MEHAVCCPGLCDFLGLAKRAGRRGRGRDDGAGHLPGASNRAVLESALGHRGGHPVHLCKQELAPIFRSVSCVVLAVDPVKTGTNLAH